MSADNNGADIETSDDNDFSSGRGLGGRKYRPVIAQDDDRAVLEMSSIDPGGRASSSLDPPNDIKKVKVGIPPDMASERKDGSLPNHARANGAQAESKLELFGFDSLVNILGLKSMAGDQIQAPSSPRDGDDVPINIEPPKSETVKSGTMMGVFIPCLQNILGIIYYIRFSWIVGMAGIGQSLVLVAFCGSCTFLTTISLSAIATNGAMKGGGPYYLIGRALGPEVGVSIGLCLLSLVHFMFWGLWKLSLLLYHRQGFLKVKAGENDLQIGTTFVKINGSDVAQTSPNLHDLQVYGVIVTIILCFIVFGGVKMINRVAPAFLIPVVLSLFCIFIGIFVARKNYPADGITGLSLESFKKNWDSAYQTTNHAGIPDPNGNIYWSFNALVGLFFPAVTGIMAGSNRSASLKDTQRSIPIGTLSATLATSGLYLVTVLFFGALATREKLLTDRLLTATVAWPVPGITYVGIILSTLGAALQSLTGAPRLLAAIANDDILPVLKYFKSSRWG
ncbi:UNVERIFIED_CONTAM: Cation-chloride cotransporter 1 [Sesamum radiatum]|uniref:Cation-chloride cotransporter 1 n=1 Tax=Sesamum radiatum TaxID=300843 RepID=A0AAW2K206_SESRA